MTPPTPDDDPQWKTVNALWADHYWGRNLDELLSVLAVLKDRKPDRVETYLWLAQVHYLHARYHSRERAFHYEKAEMYAAKACRMEPKYSLAVKILVVTLFNSRDRQYIFHTYGDLISSFAPLPFDEALPDMRDLDGWDEFKQFWDERADIEKAKKAIAIMEEMASRNLDSVEAQTWASRVHYYAGEYYTSLGEHSEGKPYYKKAAYFAEKAVTLNPNSVPANYWMLSSITRNIQYQWLIFKARYLMTLLTPTLYCARENSFYYFGAPMLMLGVMISNGGWVTEKGLALAGANTEVDMNALELLEILYPDYYFPAYQRAEILASKGSGKEAMDILQRLLTKASQGDRQIPENRICLNFAKRLYDDLQKDLQ